MKKHNYLIILLLTFTSVIGQTIHNINNPEDLSDLALAPGDQVILADGTYDTDERVKFLGNGTEESPITFRPETPGGVVFTGGMSMSIGGNYLVVDGFYWNGGFGASNFIQFRDGTTYAQHSTIQNCAINGLGVNPDDFEVGSSIKHRWIVLYGNYNNVLNCSFMNKSNAGALVLVELEFNAEADRCIEVGHTISNNYFYKYDKIDTTLTNAGDSETIRVGTSEFQNVNCATVVSNNYFVEADGENEIISNKSDNNIYVNNTFRRSRGSLVLRHGSGAIVQGNVFLGENVNGTGGLRIVDSDHIITDNFIQDCITSEGPQVIWNNGITFMGGSQSSVDDCTSLNVSNGYQKSEDLIVSNNTIVNTHSPLFYNGSKGKSDIGGVFSDNLIYFDQDSNNISEIIAGDDADSFSSFGASLTYSDNVYNNTSIIATVDGFVDTTLTATSNGELFDIVGADGKGANLNGYEPITDDMVGNGIGACFLDFQASIISNPDCTIQEVEPIATLNVSSVSAFLATEDAAAVTVSANVSWTAVSNDNWITINPGEGDGDADLTVSVDPNPTFEIRTGSVTFTQVDGDIVRTLSVSQEGLDITSNFILINDKSATDGVIVHSFSKQQVGFDDGADRTNFATNTLDKDPSTRWAANDLEDIAAGDIKADGEFVIYDLGATFNLGLIQLSSDGKSDAYGYQIWTSNSGVADSDFTKLLPESTDIMLTQAGSSEFQQTEVSASARYVKLIGFGRFDSDITERKSFWTNITEIEFYRTDEVLSVDDFSSTEELGIVMYPNPTSGLLNISRESLDFNNIRVYTVLGEEVLVLELNSTNSLTELDLSNLNAGLYFVEISNGNQKAVSRIIVAD